MKTRLSIALVLPTMTSGAKGAGATIKKIYLDYAPVPAEGVPAPEPEVAPAFQVYKQEYPAWQTSLRREAPSAAG